VSEDKRRSRRRGAVYYTPTYIVEYIRQEHRRQAVGGKTPQGRPAKLRMLDPACGSGSFLIGAYQFCFWTGTATGRQGQRREWSKGKSPALYQARAKEYRLTAAERKRILLNNIYGVDIDPQAGRSPNCPLLLKVLEGETSRALTSS